MYTEQSILDGKSTKTLNCSVFYYYMITVFKFLKNVFNGLQFLASGDLTDQLSWAGFVGKANQLGLPLPEALGCYLSHKEQN